MTPEEFNREFSTMEKVIGYECPVPIKKAIWAKCKDRPVDYLKKCLVVYKFCWNESDEMREAIKRHANS